MLEINNMVKKYGSFTAVDGVSMCLKKGEVVGLLGPNGAGKSTIIKSIVGLLQIKGEIRINGLLNRSINAKKRVAYIPEFPALYELLTVKEHLKFISYAYSVENWERAADELLEKFFLKEKANNLARDLSKGMKQKLSICCGLIINPDLYVFDEPLSGLDPKSILILKDIIINLGKRGKTVLISSHLLDFLETFCDRCLILNKGKIISDIELKSIENKKRLEEFYMEKVNI